MNAFFLKVLLGCTLFLVSSIFTFANTSYSISPMRSELLLSPSTFSTGEVTLHNGGNEIKNFEVYFEECVKSGDAFNCGAYLSGGTVANSLSFWINIPEGKKYTISPNSSKKIQYSITIPSSVKGGSYFGVIKASEITGESNDLYIKSVVLGSSLLLTVNTDIQSSLDVGKPSISTSTLSIKFNIPVKNSGNVYLKPIGKIEIFDNNQLLQAIGEKFLMSDDLVITGKEITNFIPFNFEGINILPNEERDFIGEWRGFATNKLDQAQKITIEYQSPSEYFSNQDKKIKIGYPFYTTISREKMKNLTAKISVNDNGSIPNGKDYIQEVPFTIKYQGIEVVPNFAIFFWLKHILNFL